MLLFKILFFHPNIVICFSTSSPIGLSDMSKCCLCPREAVPNRSPQKEWRSWHQSHTTPPPTADEIFQRGHLPPPLRFYGVPTHVDSLKWAWQLKNIKSVCVFKNNLWLGIKKWLLNKNRIYFFASVYFFSFSFFFSVETPHLQRSFRSCVCFMKHLARNRCHGNPSTPSGSGSSFSSPCTWIAISPDASQMVLFSFFNKFWMQQLGGGAWPKFFLKSWEANFK